MVSGGNLFLGGGGDLDVSAGLDKLFFSNFSSHSHLLYIPIALPRINNSDWFYSLVTRYSSVPIANIDTLFIDDKIMSLSKYDGIYIGGGNTYRLLDCVVKTGLNFKLCQFLSEGKFVYGGSAGAIIFGKTIATVAKKERQNYRYDIGLNFCNNKSFTCHYKEENFQIYKNISNILKTDLIAIPEDGGVIYNYNHELVCKIGNVVEFKYSFYM